MSKENANFFDPLGPLDTKGKLELAKERLNLAASIHRIYAVEPKTFDVMVDLEEVRQIVRSFANFPQGTHRFSFTRPSKDPTIYNYAVIKKRNSLLIIRDNEPIEANTTVTLGYDKHAEPTWVKKGYPIAIEISRDLTRFQPDPISKITQIMYQPVTMWKKPHSIKSTFRNMLRKPSKAR